MGPEYWKPDKPTRLKKCDEFVVGTCNEPTDGCCAVVPCRYCLLFEGSYRYTGLAVFDENGWVGEINGSTFFGYWQRNLYSGECEFVVLIDGYEVYRKSCYEGQSCRNSSDSVETSLGNDAGVLSWTVLEGRPLEYLIDPDTGCRTTFCGGCECTCECLCVSVNPPYGTYFRGEICDTSYPCDPPTWEGSVGGVDISLTLGRDSYGNCVLSGSAGGEYLEEVITGCSVSATWELYDGTQIIVVCKVCECEEVLPPCCAPRCEPLQLVSVGEDLVEIPGSCDSPLPLTLKAELTSTSTPPGFSCFNGEGVLTFRTPLSSPPGEFCWEGEISGSCTDCNGATFNWTVIIKVCCDANLGEHTVAIVPGSGMLCPATTLVAEEVDAVCDPFLLSGCFPAFGACWVGCLDEFFMPTDDQPVFDVCFLIYEEPEE